MIVIIGRLYSYAQAIDMNGTCGRFYIHVTSQHTNLQYGILSIQDLPKKYFNDFYNLYIQLLYIIYNLALLDFICMRKQLT